MGRKRSNPEDSWMPPRTCRGRSAFELSLRTAALSVFVALSQHRPRYAPWLECWHMSGFALCARFCEALQKTRKQLYRPII